MFKLISLLLSLSLTLSWKVIGIDRSELTIDKGGKGNIGDLYQVLYDTPKQTIYFNDVASTIDPKSILINSDSQEVKMYGVSYNNGIVPLTRKTQHLSGSFQRSSQASQVKPSYIAFTAGVGSPIILKTDVSYQASGFNWAAYYSLYLNPDQTRANVLGQVKIENKSGKNFTNTELYLSTGNLRPRSFYLQNGVFVQKGSVKITPDQQVNSIREYIIRQKANKITQGINSVELFKTIKNAPVKKIFTATIETQVPRQQVKFTTEYRVGNRQYYDSSESFPKGTGRIYKMNSRGVTQQLAMSPTEHVDPWSDFKFKAGSPSNIKSQYFMNGNEVQIKITNIASIPANIELQLLNSKKTMINYMTGYKGPRWEMVDKYLKTSTTIPANSAQTIKWNEFENRSGKK